MWELGAQLGAQLLGSYLFNQGQGQSKRLQNAQARLAEQAGDIFGKQSAMDMPYRQNLYGALTSRAGQQFPRILPQSPSAPLNPRAGGARPTLPTMGPSGANGPGPQRDPMTLLRAIMAARGGAGQPQQ